MSRNELLKWNTLIYYPPSDIIFQLHLNVFWNEALCFSQRHLNEHQLTFFVHDFIFLSPIGEDIFSSFLRAPSGWTFVFFESILILASSKNDAPQMLSGTFWKILFRVYWFDYVKILGHLNRMSLFVVIL